MQQPGGHQAVVRQHIRHRSAVLQLGVDQHELALLPVQQSRGALVLKPRHRQLRLRQLLQMLLQRSHLLLQVRHVARQPGAQLQYVHRPQVQHFRCQEERLAYEGVLGRPSGGLGAGGGSRMRLLPLLLPRRLLLLTRTQFGLPPEVHLVAQHHKLSVDASPCLRGGLHERLAKLQAHGGQIHEKPIGGSKLVIRESLGALPIRFHRSE
mmetsp:Transcript_14402/g.43545  ORF Transcript_14402/g.43545 Transcript_14402/m.43545 type:complete len:209 (-) Transcript_14402:1181-1807(-)